MRSSILTVAALTFVPLGAAAAQAVQPKSGDRIRITATPYSLKNRIARVLNVRSDTLLLQVGWTDTLAVALDRVTRLEVSTASRRFARRGAVIGSLIGVATGAISGYASGDDDNPTGWNFFARTASEKARLGGTILGVTGLVIGAVWGANTVSDHWTSVPLGAAKAPPSQSPSLR